jgi:SAM-dependent methyltransferase
MPILTNTRLFLLFLIIQTIQLILYTNRTPHPLTPDLTPVSLDLVFKRCLKAYNLAIRSHPNQILPEDIFKTKEKKEDDTFDEINTYRQMPIYRPKLECKEGFWEISRSLCICDHGFMGETCEIPITYCSDDVDRQKKFDWIYDTHYWDSKESKSGPGSNIYNTAAIRRDLPLLMYEYNFTSLLDAPCGDLNWMKTVEFIRPIEYVGLDIVKKLVERHREKYRGSPNYKFIHRDFVMFPPYKIFDLILARDVLQHLNHVDREKVIKNWENSGSKYVLTTLYTNKWNNSDIVTGETGYLNLMEPPYNFVDPIKWIVDENPGFEKKEGKPVKNLGLWKLPIKRKKISILGRS